MLKVQIQTIRKQKNVSTFVYISYSFTDKRVEFVCNADFKRICRLQLYVKYDLAYKNIENHLTAYLGMRLRKIRA